MQDNLSLTGSSHGKGIRQQWHDSCNATTVQAVHGEMDPLYALKVHEENPNFGKVDDSDATKDNPKMAQEQKDILTSTYTGTFTGAHSGVAVNRNATGGSGRFADDQFTKLSGSTGVTYKTQDVGTGVTMDGAITTIDSGVGQGVPVPIVVGDGGAHNKKFGHYVVVTGVDKGPPKRYNIHDPWTGNTLVRTEDQIRNGNMNVAGWNKLGAIDQPTIQDSK